MKLKNILLTALSLVLVAAVAVGGTLAYLTMNAGNENNVFSVGNIDVSLSEEVGIFGEGGEVKQTEDGAEYIEVMPGDYLKKEVTVSNNGKTDAYVAVTVVLNNADLINEAIDEVYGDGDEGGQAMYDFIFDGWGINQDPRPGAYGVSDARGVIDGAYGLPAHVLHVDFAKTTSSSTVIGATNWFIAGNEKAGQYWVDNSRGEGKVDNGYYTKEMADYEICYTYYMLLPAGESTTLFNGLNVPADFTNEQITMFDGLEIKVEAAAIQADNMAVAAQYKNDPNGKAKTAFAILAGDIEAPEFSSKPTGKNAVGFTSADAIWGESTGNAKQSFEIKIYSGNTYMGYASLNNIDNIIDGDVTVTWTLYLDNAKNGTADSYWNKSWVVAPSIDVQPTTVELWIDGEKVAEGGVQMNAPDNLNKIGGAVIDANGTILRYVVKGTDANVQDGETYVAFVSNDNEMDAAIKNGATTLVLGSGTYHMPDSAKGKTLTVNGNKNTIIVMKTDTDDYDASDYSLDGSTVTFNGITHQAATGGTAQGYARAKLTFNDCDLNGYMNLGDNATFNDCTFNVSGDLYCIWTWGAANATFNGCTFNTDGKAILLYGTVNTKLSVNDCVFNDNGGLTDLKAAIEIGNYNKSYELIVNDTTVNGYEINNKGINTGTTLWGNKDSMGKDKLNVIVDGVDVY